MAKIRTTFIVIVSLVLITFIVNYFFPGERLGGGYTYEKCDSVYGPMDSIQFVSFCSKNKNIPLLQ